MESLQQRAQTLTEALPYLRRFRGSTIVIKYGGAAMVDADLRADVISDIVLLTLVGVQPVLVHGGGPEISEMMNRLGKKASFVEGLRVTDAETAEIAEMVLVGKTNQAIVTEACHQGARAIGLSGKDADLMVAKKAGSRQTKTHSKKAIDLGHVGEVEKVNPEVLETLAASGYLPVIAPIGVGPKGETFNINADHAAASIAVALKAEKLILLTDAPGVLADRSDPSSLVSELSASKAKRMISTKQIDAGMIPKVRACLEARSGGVEGCHIIDGRLSHALLMELFTDVGIGTMVR
ncbi:MAG: acetylglutamate kinase [Armatimonadetes bacterium]|nr:acetylglutamate kinase [Armatimonadota bacterium]NIM23394.1 acetylglutamate kinase [Armatimonadota bacterium]NIM67259.1 acetylglutamate kinase [Armatimonadota bacterium]NIM75757.1 acetylglutamate kinase [Armatimonadota bacterium]NIN05445.1 acetylglutamate kinase [Armatimonadota bacterium]